MRKNIFFLGMLVCLLALGLVGCGGGKATSASDFTYGLTEDGKGIKITGYTGKATKVVVPEKIEGLPVIELDDNVFDGNTSTATIQTRSGVDQKMGPDANSNNNAAITSITLPNTVTRIGFYAFNKTSITEFKFPDGIEFIPMNVFNNCELLVKVTLPRSLNEIGTEAFFGCKNLSELIIPDSITSVKFREPYGTGEKPNNRAFLGCGKLPIKTRQIIQGWGYTGTF